MDKNRPKLDSIDEYIREFPPEIQKKLEELRDAVISSAPGAEERISYGMPAFYLKGNLVYFAAYKNHIGFYPTPSGIEAFRDELQGYKSSKGAVQFPVSEPLPLDLIARITEFRVRENLENTKK